MIDRRGGVKLLGKVPRGESVGAIETFGVGQVVMFGVDYDSVVLPADRRSLFSPELALDILRRTRIRAGYR